MCHQHRSTITAPKLVHNQIQEGPNAKLPHARTIMIALDMSRAFDTGNHSQLMDKILQSSLLPFIARWFINYLQRRQSYVHYRGRNSKYRKSKPAPSFQHVLRTSQHHLLASIWSITTFHVFASHS